MAQNAPALSLLEQKLAKSGFKDLSDQEILELLLSFGTPNKDYRRLAIRIVNRFKTLQGLLDTSAEQVRRIPGVSNRDFMLITALREMSQKYLKQRIQERPVYNAGGSIFDYLHSEMRDLDAEHFKMLCLDDAKRITESIDIMTLAPGTCIVESSRAVIEHAITHGANYFVVAHNHVSGDPRPSNIDRDITRDIVFAGMIIQISLLDHVILGKDSFFSFANEGLIEEYEAEFGALKLRGTAEAKRRLALARTTFKKH